MSVNSPVSHSFSQLTDNSCKKIYSRFNQNALSENSGDLYDSSEEDTTDDLSENVEPNIDNESDISTDSDLPDLVSDVSEDELPDEYSVQNKINKMDIIYLVKVDDNVITYGTSIEEIDDTVKYIIEKLSNKYKLSGFNNVYTDNILKISNDNKIITNVYGKKNNTIMSYEQILFTVSIHVVPKYTKLNFDKIKI